MLQLATAIMATTDAGWELLVTTVPNITDRTCFDAPGLPDWLRGTYLVSGPAKWELGKYKMNAIFDGFGMSNRFELRDGKVCYTSVWMETMYQNVSAQKECVVGVLFEDTTPARPLSCYSGGAQMGGTTHVGAPAPLSQSDSFWPHLGGAATRDDECVLLSCSRHRR